MEPTYQCQKCHYSLQPGALICPNCGTPAPGVSVFEPEQPQVSSPESYKPGKSKRFWLGLFVIVGGSLCGCLALVMGFLTFTGELSKSSNLIQSKPITPSAVSPQISQPQSLKSTSTIEAAVFPPAQKETPTENSSMSNATQYFDDFSNLSSGWENSSLDSFTMGYFQKGNYAIKINVPMKMTFAIPPYPFKKPVENIIFSVKAQGSGGNGFYGVMCHYQDKYNFYRISFSGDKFAVDKMVKGQLTELTQPFWKKLIAYTPAADGYMTIQMACTDGRIQLLVNDIGQVIINNEDLDHGDVTLFAAAGDKKNADGVYEQAFFDDFSAELPQP
jgi:hypothetical protein